MRGWLIRDTLHKYIKIFRTIILTEITVERKYGFCILMFEKIYIKQIQPACV